MELELRIRGDATEIEQVVKLLKGIGQPGVVTRNESLDDFAREFVGGDLSEEGRGALKKIIEKSIDGPGATESELKDVLGGTSIDITFVYGVMGGLGRRWSAIVGPEHGTPFRKNKSLGTYQLPHELAIVLQGALGE